MIWQEGTAKCEAAIERPRSLNTSRRLSGGSQACRILPQPVPSASGLGCSLIPGVVVKLIKLSLPDPWFSPR